MDQLPSQFLERLKIIVPSDRWEAVIESFQPARTFTVRVNTLKAAVDTVKALLKKEGIAYTETVLEEALTINSDLRDRLMESDIHREGLIYIQNLSSQLIARLLDPRPDESVLDMCAAPGSKTTHIAALMQGRGTIVALEKVVGRYHKLKSVVQLMNAANVTVKCLDAKRFRVRETFDRILVDAPCSSEGRFDPADPESFAYWSLRKIKEMRSKQKGLLHRAAQLLKVNGTLLYSTCTFAPEENEEVIDWVVRKMDGNLETVPIELPSVPVYPALATWQKRTFAPEIRHAVRIAPVEPWQAFFAVKLRRRS